MSIKKIKHPLFTGRLVSFFSQLDSRCRKSDIMCRVSLVRETFFDIQSRVKHLKRNQMPHKHGAFRFVFGVQHGLWQKQALIKSKIKTNKKIRLREENISAIMLGLLFYDRHCPFLSFFSLLRGYKLY